MSERVYLADLVLEGAHQMVYQKYSDEINTKTVYDDVLALAKARKEHCESKAVHYDLYPKAEVMGEEALRWAGAITAMEENNLQPMAKEVARYAHARTTLESEWHSGTKVGGSLIFMAVSLMTRGI